MNTTLAPAAATKDAGHEAYELMRRLFPLCRSLTGDGVRATFDILEEEIPIVRTEIPSGTRVFDWNVPDEWNLREAYIAAPDGSRVVDLRDSTLHVVSYSEPVHATLSLDALRERLHTLPEQPDVVPYRTSYYERTWGFCLSHRKLLELQPGEYEVVIDSTLEPGHLTYAELLIEGEGEGEVLVSTYVCHPSLANDNLSGIAVATSLGEASPGAAPPAQLPLPLRARHDRPTRLAPSEPRRARSHRARSDALLHRGRRKPDLQAQPSRGRRGGPGHGDRSSGTRARRIGVLPWEPWGGDERQFCAPGFDLPVGTLMRTPHGEFSGYHTSADGLERIRPEALAEAVDTCLELVEVLETNRRCLNLSPFGEPQLGRRGLYRSAGGAVATPDDERALLWVLNESDGRSSLIDIASRSGLTYAVVARAAERLERADLLAASSGERGGEPTP